VNEVKSKKLRGLTRFCAAFSLAFIISLVFALISRIGLPYISVLFIRFHLFIGIAATIIAIFLFLFSFGTVPYTFKGIGLPGPSETIQLILTLMAILIILWVFPALIIYWFTNHGQIKGAIKIGVFFSSTFLALIFYLSNKSQFKSPVDIVSFFSGACLGPVAVIEILL